MEITPKSEVEKILAGSMPSRFVYAPNYWQWFKHHQDHNKLPEEIKHCKNLLDLYNYLGVDIFSRNIYSDPEAYWFGGLCDEVISGLKITSATSYTGKDKLTIKEYASEESKLTEELLYIFNESTLVQKGFLINDYINEAELFRIFLKNRKWIFNSEKYKKVCHEVGEKGVVIAGEFFSPLKMLHLAMGPVNSVYFLLEYPEIAVELLKIHEDAQLECIADCVSNGVKVVMSMDNLDTMFHPPDFVREFSASYYEKASSICRRNDALFFIHACGQQKGNLGLISSCYVDGLEGVASPPLGDVSPVEVMTQTHGKFIMTGGISAMETRNLKTRNDVFKYVETLFRQMIPYKNRFIFSSSCNTAIDTSWDTIRNFRDAWLRFRDME